MASHGKADASLNGEIKQTCCASGTGPCCAPPCAVRQRHNSSHHSAGACCSHSNHSGSQPGTPSKPAGSSKPGSPASKRLSGKDHSPERRRRKDALGQPLIAVGGDGDSGGGDGGGGGSSSSSGDEAADGQDESGWEGLQLPLSADPGSHHSEHDARACVAAAKACNGGACCKPGSSCGAAAGGSAAHGHGHAHTHVHAPSGSAAEAACSSAACGSKCGDSSCSASHEHKHAGGCCDSHSHGQGHSPKCGHDHSHDRGHDHHHSHSHAHSNGNTHGSKGGCCSGDHHHHHHHGEQQHTHKPHSHDHGHGHGHSHGDCGSACAKAACCDHAHGAAPLHAHKHAALHAGGKPGHARSGGGGGGTGGGDRYVHTRARAEGLCCPMEANLCHSVLNGLPGVSKVQVSVISKLVTVHHDPAALSPAAVVAALNGVGLRARLLVGGHHADGAAAAADGGGGGASHVGGAGGGLAGGGWRPPWQVFVCGALVGVSMAGMLAPPPAHAWLEAAGLAAAAVGSPAVIYKAWSSLKGRILDINALMLVAMAGAVALGDWSEAGALVFLFSLAEWLEAKCMGRAAGALEEVLRMQPETALLLQAAGGGGGGGGCCSSESCGGCGPGGAGAGKAPGAGGSGGGAADYVRVPTSELQPGDLVLVRPGDKVPVDGTVVDGSSTVDESMLTGESRPVPKAPGAAALAGTVNSGAAALAVRAGAAPGDSTVARLAALIEQAGQSKSRRDRVIERFARFYTPAVVALAVAAMAVGLLVDASRWRDWLYMALVVLVTACPCALVISTPVASVSGLARAAKQGVLIKGSRYLELLGRLGAVCLDKTGTLTQGAFEIKAVHAFGGFDERAALRWASALERHSTHPVAAAIVGYAAARGAGGGAVATGVREEAGKGVSGVVAGAPVSVVSWAHAHALLTAAGAAGAGGGGGSGSGQATPSGAAAANAAACGGSPRPPAAAPPGALAAASAAGSPASAAADAARAARIVDDWASRGASAVAVVVSGRLAALLLMADGLRPDAAAAVGELRALGLRLSIMTGDSMGAASAVAEQLGIDPSDTYAELLPQDKLQMLDVLRRGMAGGAGGGRGGGRAALAHVGDGINDAPALAAADVGVAMGAAGAAAAVEAADVALFGSDLAALAFAIRLGRRAGRVVAVNIAFAVFVKVAVLAAAAAGFTSLWLSLLADVGASLAVTLHALSLLRFEAWRAGAGTISGDDAHGGAAGEATGAGGSGGRGGGGGLLRRAARALGMGPRYSELGEGGDADGDADGHERYGRDASDLEAGRRGGGAGKPAGAAGVELGGASAWAAARAAGGALAAAAAAVGSPRAPGVGGPAYAAVPAAGAGGAAPAGAARGGSPQRAPVFVLEDD